MGAWGGAWRFGGGIVSCGGESVEGLRYEADLNMSCQGTEEESCLEFGSLYGTNSIGCFSETNMGLTEVLQKQGILFQEREGKTEKDGDSQV